MKNLAVTQSKNIMIYDHNGKIVEELHSDGTDVTYEYSNGKMVDSIDNHGYMQMYKQINDHLLVSDYLNGKLISKHHSAHLSANHTPLSPTQTRNAAEQKLSSTIQNKLPEMQLNPDSTTSYENYYVNGVLMNDIAQSEPNNSTDMFLYRTQSNMTQIGVQDFLVSQGSILQNSVEIYRMNSTGTVYDTGTQINPAAAIFNAAFNHDVNPKVILATLQKESSLISSPPGSVPYSSRRFYYAMGYGATDSGDINGTSGLDVQIDKGAETLYDGWLNSPGGPYPTLFSPINNGQTATSNGVTYQDYIWVDNYGTWSLFNYTPWALDTTLLPSISGGNYLFYQIFNGYWGVNWS